MIFVEINLPLNDMYYLYILKCADDSLYTGITTDLERRVEEHNSSKVGAKYTKCRRPVELVYSKRLSTRSAASKEEARIKALNREEKLEIIRKGNSGNKKKKIEVFFESKS